MIRLVRSVAFKTGAITEYHRTPCWKLKSGIIKSANCTLYSVTMSSRYLNQLSLALPYKRVTSLLTFTKYQHCSGFDIERQSTETFDVCGFQLDRVDNQPVTVPMILTSDYVITVASANPLAPVKSERQSYSRAAKLPPAATAVKVILMLLNYVSIMLLLILPQ